MKFLVLVFAICFVVNVYSVGNNYTQRVFFVKARASTLTIMFMHIVIVKTVDMTTTKLCVRLDPAPSA